MKFHSEKKKSSGISGKCITRIATMLGSICLVGVGVCGFLLFSYDYSSAVENSVIESYRLSSSPMPDNKKSETPEQALQAGDAINQNITPTLLIGGDHKKAIKVDAINQTVTPKCRDFNHDVLRPTHGCQVNRDMSMVFCQFNNLRIDVSKIKCDRGGEPLESVMGRNEQAEFPVYENGAFSTSKKPDYEVPLQDPNHLDYIQYQRRMHYMKDVLSNMRYPEKNNEKIDMECTETWSGTTMFITRYEYVNMYHTMTDWWNAYFLMPPKDTNIRVVFLDGHAKGNLDPAWEQMFGNFTYVQHLPKGGVCFEKAVFIPAGYVSALWPNMDKILNGCPRQKLADEFSNHVLKSFNLQNPQRIPGKIVIIDRKPYICHPRSKPENAQRILTNLDELRQRLLKVERVTSVELLGLESMSFGEQLSAIRDAHILIGNHGAGLTHLLFMDRKSHVVEFMRQSLDFFTHLCKWKGVQHTPIRIKESHTLSASDIKQIANAVESILS